MASRHELGVSQQEYEDAVNLEKVYNMMSRHVRCENCDRKNPTHVDVNRHEFLCAGCASGKGNCKQVGSDRLKSADVRILERKYKKAAPIKSSLRAPRRDRGDNYRPRRIKSPSPVASSVSDAEYTSEDEEEVRPVSRREPHHAKSRGVRSVSYTGTSRNRNAIASAAFNNGLAEGGMGNMYDESTLQQETAQSVPGMRGVLMVDALQQQQQAMPSYGSPYMNPPSSGGLQTSYPQSLAALQQQQRAMQGQPPFAFGDNVGTMNRFSSSAGASLPMPPYQTPALSASRPFTNSVWPMPLSNVNLGSRPSVPGTPFSQLTSPSIYPGNAYPSSAIETRNFLQPNPLRPSYNTGGMHPGTQQSQFSPSSAYPQMSGQLNAVYTPSWGTQQPSPVYSMPNTRVPPASSNPFAASFSPTSAFPGMLGAGAHSNPFGTAFR
ncbi:hypothetical protein IE077_000519 [Cardiosporidium cionae]|uniref:Uncharacterized protein n=1 Tax=Cardiosporidium cionae TaxID=476202 RepID=A0ABQ7J9K5_9APIC|nr:hypothetical protein IE077_000519 [Cardiosporidium cionae]|eukprot:KAF8820330.1 hypothetical protein IE077_000519 [Cardiosporidium cionae]